MRHITRFGPLCIIYRFILVLYTIEKYVVFSRSILNVNSCFRGSYSQAYHYTKLDSRYG